MSTQLQTAFWIADTTPRGQSLRKLADRVLNAAAAFWFVVVVLGQLVFAFTVASFYGLSAARGNWQQWNKTMTHGYTPGHPMGNLAVAIHLSSAVIILLSGAIQLVPLIRRRPVRRCLRCRSRWYSCRWSRHRQVHPAVHCRWVRRRAVRCPRVRCRVRCRWMLCR